MSEQTQQEDTQEKQPIIIQLVLNFDQVNAIVNAVGKLPTELGVWPLRQIIIDQTNQQLMAFEEAQKTEQTEQTEQTVA